MKGKRGPMAKKLTALLWKLQCKIYLQSAIATGKEMFISGALSRLYIEAHKNT